MKYLILLVLLFNMILEAKIIVNQNIKALYKNVNLTEEEKEYIELNKDINTLILQKALDKDFKKENSDKNVISFILTPNGKIKNFKFLVKADKAKLNRKTKQIVYSIADKFVQPKKKIELRFIIRFYKNKYSSQESKRYTNSKKKDFYQTIYPGTSRFDYSSKEYVRVFETSEDGFVNISASPGMCATFSLLTDKNQKIYGNLNPWSINKNILKGKYKLLIRVKKRCNVSIQYIQ